MSRVSLLYVIILAKNLKVKTLESLPKNESFFLVYSTKDMIGTFSPQLEPYTNEMPEEKAPSGFLARGSYTAKSKVCNCSTKFYLLYTLFYCIL